MDVKESKEKSFDWKSLRSLKSLKAYTYFNEELVKKNLRLSQTTNANYIYIRCHYMTSLTSKVYTVYVCCNVIFSAKYLRKLGKLQ